MGKYYKQIGQKMKNMEEQKYNGKMVGLKLLIINIIKLKKVIQLNLNGNKVEGFQDQKEYNIYLKYYKNDTNNQKLFKRDFN